MPSPIFSEGLVEIGLLCGLSNNLDSCVVCTLTFSFRCLNLITSSITLEQALDFPRIYIVDPYSVSCTTLEITIMVATILCLCSISYLVYGTSLTTYAQQYI